MNAHALRVLPGRPRYPGRAKLLHYPRPWRRPPTPAAEIGMFGALCLVWGVLLGWGFRNETVVRERVVLEETRETNENLDLLLAQYQCELLHAEADMLFRTGERWPALKTALTPDMRAWCRGKRP